QKGSGVMGQITIYLDSETEKRLINTIKKSGKSKSKWVADLIREKTAGSWPENIINLAGAWSNLPTAEEIRKKMGRDVKRESI
ncbi:MAG: TraY domain-containing protein, partial [Desulfobacterales bacterium]